LSRRPHLISLLLILLAELEEKFLLVGELVFSNSQVGK